MDKRNAEITDNTVFSLMASILMSENIKTWTSTIYPHLIESMDNYYSASGIASDTQFYLDQRIRKDTTSTLDPTVMYAHRMQWPEKPNHYPISLTMCLPT